MADIGFLINLKGGEAILQHNQKLQTIEQDFIEKIKSQAEANFLQSFGFQGKFEVSFFMTDRISFKVHGADGKTIATLEKNPKWLDQFTKSVVF